MKRFGFLFIMMLVVTVLFSACGKDPFQGETIPSETTSVPEQTSSAPVVESTSGEVAQLPIDLPNDFVLLESDNRHPSPIFRHESIPYQVQTPYYVESTVSIPESVTVDGITYEIDLSSRLQVGTCIQFDLKSTNIGIVIIPKQIVRFDAVTGTMIGIGGFEFDLFSEEEKTLSYRERALMAIEKYLPNVQIEDYELDYEDGYGGTPSRRDSIVYQVQYVRKQEGIEFHSTIYVSMTEFGICFLSAHNPYIFDDFDIELLKNIDAEEHQKVLNSVIDYVRNGHELCETVTNRMIIRMADGRYALRYEVSFCDKQYGFWDEIIGCFPFESE